MTEALKAAIEQMTKALEQKLLEVAELKNAINTIARQMGDEAPYTDVAAEQVKTAGSPKKLRPDQFFGKSPTTAAREYLEILGKPATAEELLHALTAGGFDFESQGWKDDKYRLKNLAISLGKNSAIFTRLPSGPFGLAKWYPGHSRKAPVKPKSDAEGDEGGGDDDGGLLNDAK
jgi:hypothetical protein